MFEPSNLVLNLNEIMEEYDEMEEEVLQVTQEEIEEEESVETRVESKQPMEETRKKKRGAEETGVEHSEEKANDWVSQLAYVTWRDKL